MPIETDQHPHRSASGASFPGNSRPHIALAAADLVRSTDFYRALLGEGPTKERPGYVKFEPREPSLNLTLNEVGARVPQGAGMPAHYGIQVKSALAVREARSRLEQAGIVTRLEEHTTCCYAVQDKVWATDPDGNAWEVFVVTETDADSRSGEGTCCATSSSEAASCC